MAKNSFGDLPRGNAHRRPRRENNNGLMDDYYDDPLLGTGYEYNYHYPAMPLFPDTNSRFSKSKSVEKKGKSVSVLQVSETTAETEKRHMDDYAELEVNFIHSELSRAIGISFILFLAATALEFFRIEIGFLPSFMKLEFSIFPEFIALVFYGPIVSACIVLLKNLAHMMIFYIINSSFSYAGELSSLLTDTIFIIIAFLIYNAIKNGKPSRSIPRNIRVKGVAIAGVGSAIFSSILLLPIMKYLIYPLFIKYFQANGYTVDFLALYQEKLASISSVWQGLLVFNLPWEIGKLICVTILATVTYYIVKSRE